jgi:hypothetical protein
MNKQSCKFYPVPSEHFALSGFPWYDENNDFFRLPHRATSTLSDHFIHVAGHPSGGMVRFRSSTQRLFIKAHLGWTELFPDWTLACASGFDVYIRKGSGFTHFRTIKPNKNIARFTVEAEKKLPTGVNDIAIYFPTANEVQSLEIGIDNDSTIEKPWQYKNACPIVFYGSSITESCTASRPGLAYPALVCRACDCPLVNLGFGGNALGQKEVAALIAELSMSAFVMDYDHNAPNAGHLRNTHYNFYSTIRKAHPRLPIVIMSAPSFHIHKQHYNERHAAVEESYTRARATGDRRVFFIDGRKHFPTSAFDDCTFDGVHPNDLGYYLIARRIIKVLQAALK